ncbi:MAG: hypothetical protein EXR66_00115 [Dehalococcoidia bacterium]|nr:hypothetical protein [Dehalococcoidia bacterium]
MGIWVGRYAIANGEVLEHGPWLVERRRVRDDDAIRLLVLAEPVDERSAEFAHEVADAIASLFRRESLSLTGGLLRALRQAHANLAEWNRRSLREHRVAVGITCVAIRDREATIAQLGPGTVFVRTGELVRPLERQPASRQPLGGTDAVEPDFTRIALEHNDLLLLTSNVAESIGIEAISAALQVGPERALADLFLATRNLEEMTAVLIANLPQIPDEDEDAPLDDGRGVPGLREQAAPVRVESSSDPQPRPYRAAPRLRQRTAGSRGILPAALLDWRRGAAGLGGLLLLIAIAWGTLPGLLREDREARFVQAAALTRAQLNSAAQEQDPERAREALTLAQAALAEARGLAPSGDARVAELERSAAELAASLDRVTQVSDLRTVLAFQGAISAPLQGSLLAGANLLWIVDRGRGRVSVFDPAGAAPPREVYRSGDRYDGLVARDPMTTAWDQQGSRLLVLDAERALWGVTAGAPPARLTLRGTADLRSTTAITSYAGNLYVLDGRANEVWRYIPAGTGYDSERTALLGGGTFTDARALLVDGDVFVLDGPAVRHFRLSAELPALLRGIDRAPAAPVAIAEDVQRSRFYVADPEARRVVVSDRGGAFTGQLRHPAFFDLKSIALPAEGGTMYVLTSNGVYAFDPLATP